MRDVLLQSYHTRQEQRWGPSSGHGEGLGWQTSIDFQIRQPFAAQGSNTALCHDRRALGRKAHAIERDSCWGVHTTLMLGPRLCRLDHLSSRSALQLI